ncbi:MAG: hypothetical protein V4639_04540 [Pseudomonadota bacterium]
MRARTENTAALAEPPLSPTMSARDCAKAQLADQFDIDNAFVKVSKLSKILGLAPATIYGSMRKGTFFIPHRMLGSTPAVRFDDLVDWYCSDAAERDLPFPTPARRIDSSEGPTGKDLIVARVLKKMGLEPNGRIAGKTKRER